ncbi:MAG: tetratricopeptide repeat protein [Burkholderiales bacterium]
MTRRPFLKQLGVSLALAIAVGGCAMSLADQIVALMREAIAALQGKRYDEAIGKFQQVVSRDPKHWEAYVGLARGYIGRGNWSQAVTSGRQAFQISPSGADVVPAFAEALFGGGVDALKGGKFTDAIGMFVDYIKIQPSNVSAYINLGRAFIGNRQFGDALNAFVQGLGVAGGSAGERNELVRGLYDGGKQAFSSNDFRGAIGFFREYIKTDSSNVNAYLDLAKSYWNAGDRGEAVKSFSEVLKLNPTNSEALRFMLQR